jgi:thiol-disulfide isomerase/thioredoxin
MLLVWDSPVFNEQNMKYSKSVYLLVIIVSFLAAVSLIFAFNKKKEENPLLSEAKLFSEKPLPNTILIEVNSGKNFFNEVRKGKTLLIYMIAGCDPCKKEIALVNELGKDFFSEIRVFGVMSEDIDIVKVYIKKNNITIPILIDQNGDLFKALDLKYIPTNLSLENGIIKKTIFGLPKSQDEFSELLNLNTVSTVTESKESRQ